jgi:membrane-associated phospholipid phosphatase
VRRSEWILAAFFVYVASIAPSFPRAALLAACVIAVLAALRYTGYLRDWAPLALTLAAYRAMDRFTPPVRDYHFEFRWIRWDRLLLDAWRLRAAIESLGPLFPAYLELCYLLVYAVGPFAVAALYISRRRARVDRLLTLYLLGTLLSYALFPYFPSDPPRTVFAALDLPRIPTPIREWNLAIANGYGIHSSVFPSAHVSSAFSAAWALLLYLPERKWIGRGMLIYAASVALAVIYGRYHYAVDSLAGLAVSLLALLIALAADRNRSAA